MEKATANDAMRSRLPETGPGELLLVTCGIQALGPVGMFKALQKVREFECFTPDNDPWGEHDFGSFSLDGQKCFWKIDYPCEDGIERVLTVMLADEY